MVQERKITERLEELEKFKRGVLEEKYLKEKRVKLPRGLKGKTKKGWVMILLLKSNNIHDLKLLPVKDDTIYLKDTETFHLSSAEYIGMYKGKWPLMILPEWSAEPITKKVLINAMKNRKTSIEVQRHIIKLMEGTAELAAKPKKSIKGILVIGLILTAAYVIAKQMGFI